MNDPYHRRAKRAARRLLESLEGDVEANLKLISEYCGAVALDRIATCILVNVAATLAHERGHTRVSALLGIMMKATHYEQTALLEESGRWFPDRSGILSTEKPPTAEASRVEDAGSN